MREVVKVGNSTLIFNTDYVNPEEKALMLKEIAELDCFIAERHKIINGIQNIKDVRYVNILYKRYVEFKSLGKIAREMNFSYRQIKRLHEKALLRFSQQQR